MELKLEQFIESTVQLSDLRNSAPLNPCLYKVNHPTNGAEFYVMASYEEPNTAGFPINGLWVDLNANHPGYRKAFKLIQNVPADGFNNTWEEIRRYSDIFNEPQYFISAAQGPVGAQGPQGPTGPQGEVGPQGVTGPAGPTGPQGDIGGQGIQGLQGLQGVQGPTGSDGPVGPQGNTGIQGPVGPLGDPGPVGPTGPQGAQGSQGIQGSTGPQGDQGPQGVQGVQGVQGPIGNTGAQGSTGPQGDQGIQGPTGPQGVIGPIGSQGPQGLTGDTGPQGSTGPAGPTGPASTVPGPTGPAGSTGPQGPQGVQGVQGIDGQQGLQGPTGPAPVVDYARIVTETVTLLGTTTTLAILGPLSVVEGQATVYTTNLVNGSISAQVDAVLQPSGLDPSITCSIVPIEVGKYSVTVTNMTADFILTLVSAYDNNGTALNASLDVSGMNSGTPVLTLSGPNSIYEGGNANYAASFNDGNGNVTVVTNSVAYVITPASGATVSVDTVGVVTATTVAADQSSSLTADYVYQGNTYSAQKSIALYHLVPVSVAITGAASITELMAEDYSATVTYNNGVTTACTPVWSCDAPLGSIDAAGHFIAIEVAADTNGNITASLTEMGVTITQNKAVTVTDVYVAPVPVYPRAGIVNPSSPITEALVNSLTIFGTLETRGGGFTVATPLSLTSTGPTQTMMYAYPVSYGTANFLDIVSNFTGGWDGAVSGQLGPATINVTVNGVSTPFYVYKTDYPNLGTVTWAVS